MECEKRRENAACGRLYKIMVYAGEHAEALYRYLHTLIW